MRSAQVKGFTIVELIVVIVVIGILTALVVVGYNGIQLRSRTAIVQASVEQTGKQLDLYKTDNNGQYPETLTNLPNGDYENGEVTYEYTPNNSADPPTYCLTVTLGTVSYMYTPTTTAVEGVCSGHLGSNEALSPSYYAVLTATSGNSNCYINSGAAYCWGTGSYGQIGDGNTSSSSVPVAVDTTGVLAGKTVTSIDKGSSHACVSASGAAYCWGYNSSGQLGDGTQTARYTPVAVDVSGVMAGKNIIQVATGANHSCALDDQGAAYCWGEGQYGKLGSGLGGNALSPVAVATSGVLAGKTLTQIAAGGFHTCGIDSEGVAYCWGYNSNGQLGDNSTTIRSTPVAVNTDGALSGKTVSFIATGHQATCAVADGESFCWGNNSNGVIGSGSTATTVNTPTATSTSGVLSGKTVTSVSVGSTSTCAVADGKAYCWGINSSSGQLGNNSTAVGYSPVAVDDSDVLNGKTIVAVSASGVACALSDEPHLYCWGSGSSGKLGNGGTANSLVPVAVVGM